MTHTIITALICANLCTPTQVRVWDGDSIRIGAESVRIANIDAPEIDGRCDYETRLAQRAKARLAAILAGGKVVITRHKIDKYRRTLAFITVDGRDVGDQLVAAGLARTWTGRREPWC
jgi:endonuclease YncB( thermonuclease family)